MDYSIPERVRDSSVFPLALGLRSPMGTLLNGMRSWLTAPSPLPKSHR